MNKKVIVIGAGFGGLSAACYLAKAGYDVMVLEKNDHAGGRAMVMHREGFTFDLGPSWYMMPDVFDEFFADFGKKTSDYFELVKLDPSYKVFTKTDSYDVYDAPRVYELFERLEPGSSKQLMRLLVKTKHEYDTARGAILGKSMLSLDDVLNSKALGLLSNPELLGSYHRRIQKYIKHPDLQKILEFMVVFMGGSPQNIPALYTLLTHVDMGLGIWYPMGGMGKLAMAMYSLATELGVKFEFNRPVTSIEYKNNVVSGVMVGTKLYASGYVIANADYHHVETELLGENTERKWAKKVLSPSGLLIYLGVSKKIPALRHHNLFFDVDWEGHFEEVFKQRVWSSKPLIYVGVSSITDSSAAPKGHENIFILAPMANGDQPDDLTIQKTVDTIIQRLETMTGELIRGHIVFQDVRAHDYFKETFNAYKGNAFGLAHTIKQSAIWRPKIKHAKIKGLYFVGQYTNPGTGVPIVTLSGKVVAGQIKKDDV